MDLKPVIVTIMTSLFISGSMLCANGVEPDVISRALDDYEASLKAPAPPATEKPKRRRNETQIGFDIYSYKYKATVDGSPWMDYKGTFKSLFLNHTFRFNIIDPYYADFVNLFRLQARYSWAEVDYSTGIQDTDGNLLTNTAINDVPEYVVETRALLGREFPWKGLTVLPYVGAGFRYLHEDSSGLFGDYAYYDSENNLVQGSIEGNRRSSEYYYLPLGIDLKKSFPSTWSVTLNAEYDFFLLGRQNTYIVTDIGNVLTNDQKGGFGARGSIRIEKMSTRNGFFIEPFINYWDIRDSEWTPTMACVEGDEANCWGQVEPANVTHEIGLKMGMIF